MRAFCPRADATVNIDVGASTANIKVHEGMSDVDVRVMNNGTATAWVNFGTSSVTADTTNDYPVGPGVTEVLRPRPNADGSPIYAAAIASGSTGKIYFTPGTGF